MTGNTMTDSTKVPSPWLTVAEAAQRARCGVKTVYRSDHVCIGQGPSREREFEEMIELQTHLIFGRSSSSRRSASAFAEMKMLELSTNSKTLGISMPRFAWFAWEVHGAGAARSGSR